MLDGFKNNVFTVVKDYVIITIGTLMYCFAWDAFFIPNGIASGGLTGASTVIEFATGIPVSYSYIVMNAVLLLLGFAVLGKGFGFKTIYVILLSTFFLGVLPRFDIIKAIPGNPLYISEKVLVPIIGGLIEALGISWVFRRGGSTGGTDIIALIINKFWPVSPGKVYLFLDSFIIASVLLVPGKTFQDMIYGMIAMVTFSVVLDYFILGAKSTVQVLVFSKEYAKIADYINHEMNRGVTVLKATGWYTKEDRQVLLILVRKAQVQELTKLIKGLDKQAFVSISPSSSVYGEGFEEMKTGLPENAKKIISKGTLNQ